MSQINWSRKKLEDVVDTIIDYRGKTPRKTTHGIPLITAKIVKNGFIGLPQEYIAEGDYESWMVRGLPKFGDVLLTMEAPLGEVAQVKDEKVALAQRLVAIRGKPKTLDNTFLKYFLMSNSGQSELRNRETGTTVTGIKQTELRKIQIPLPPLPEQRAIADVLSALDDKIDLNRRMNHTLEQLAQALFKHMFLDNPEREGWEVKTVGDVLTIVGGSTPSTTNNSYWEDGKTNWATPKDLAPLQSPILLDTANRITDLGLRQISSGLLPAGTVLLSSRAPIGYLAICEIPVAINQGFIAIKCTSELPNYFILNWLQVNMEEIINRANGTTFLEISKSNFRLMQFRIPKKEEIENFVNLVRPMYEKITQNLKESRTLAELRDTLLPKLMSGQVRVNLRRGDS